MFLICHAILPFAIFALLFPLIKKKKSKLALHINTSSSFKNQLKLSLWMKPFLLLLSGAGHPSWGPPSLALTPAVRLCVCLWLGARDSRAPAPPRPPQRGNSQESAQQEANKYLNQCLYFPPIYISNTSSYSVSDKSKNKTLQKVKDFHNHRNRKREGENRLTIKITGLAKEAKKSGCPPVFHLGAQEG